jgi:hypothetical protein
MTGRAPTCAVVAARRYSDCMDGEGPTPATVTDRYTAWAAAHADASWAEDGRPTSLTLCGTFLYRSCHEPVAAERVELVDERADSARRFRRAAPAFGSVMAG